MNKQLKLWLLMLAAAGALNATPVKAEPSTVIDMSFSTTVEYEDFFGQAVAILNLECKARNCTLRRQRLLKCKSMALPDFNDIVLWTTRDRQLSVTARGDRIFVEADGGSTGLKRDNIKFSAKYRQTGTLGFTDYTGFAGTYFQGFDESKDVRPKEGKFIQPLKRSGQIALSLSELVGDCMVVVPSSFGGLNGLVVSED